MRAQVKRYAGLILVVLFGITALLSVNCQPPAMTPEQQKAYEDSLAQARKDSLLKANRAKCEFDLSNGYEYYKQKSWQRAIENYEEVRSLGCGPSMAENLYLYLGNAYREVGNQDSAIAIYKAGRKYLPKNKQIEVQENLVKLDPTNIDYLNDLADLYFTAQDYDNQIKTLNQILKIDPNNSAAQSSLISAMNKAGRDPIEALQERWENNPDNSSYGVEYGDELFSRQQYEEAITVFNKVTSLDPSNLRAWSRLAQSYENVDQYSNAINAYKGILKIDSNRKDVVDDISKLYVQLKDYKQAMDWANRCIRTGSKNGMGYAARGRVYQNVAADCSGGNLDFQDKLVYQMAYEDYQQAVKMGYGQVTTQIDYLQNFIPTKGDWFF
ncbi:MAG: tetratricopeptide repeat protein, partial [Calditrichota bacterium]